jgi:hypothetical protein
MLSAPFRFSLFAFRFSLFAFRFSASKTKQKKQEKEKSSRPSNFKSWSLSVRIIVLGLLKRVKSHEPGLALELRIRLDQQPIHDVQ